MVLWPEQELAEVKLIAVAPQLCMRSSHVDSNILSFAEESCWNRGVKCIFVQATHDSVDFYKMNNYKPVAKSLMLSHFPEKQFFTHIVLMQKFVN